MRACVATTDLYRTPGAIFFFELTLQIDDVAGEFFVTAGADCAIIDRSRAEAAWIENRQIETAKSAFFGKVEQHVLGHMAKSAYFTERQTRSGLYQADSFIKLLLSAQATSRANPPREVDIKFSAIRARLYFWHASLLNHPPVYIFIY